MRVTRPLAALAALAAGALGGFLLWSQVQAASGADKGHGKADPHEQNRLAAVKEGREVYAKYCAHCHGAEGKGDGPSGQGLPIKPQDLAEGRVINPLPDHFIFRVIAAGGPAVGLSPIMPPFKPQISDRQIHEVIQYIRTLARPAFDPKKVLPVAEKLEGPVQPIYFSHVIHAGSFQIACQYCHAGARRSTAASLPSVERCMGCHKIVAAQGNPEIEKLKGYWERKQPIPWVRVFKVPEHAQFTHKQHVQAGLQCQTCHGRIEAMERVHAKTGQNIVNDLKNLGAVPELKKLVGASEPPTPLTMGWCVECHRSVNAGGVAAVQKAPDHTPSVKMVAGTETTPRKAPLDCVRCHH